MRRWIALPLMVVCLATTTGVFAQVECDGRFKGESFTFGELAEVLASLRLDPADERRHHLCGADLIAVDLSGAYLMGANLSGSWLSMANLSGADLGVANLSEAFMSEANLSAARLGRADLSKASVDRADLSGAHLPSANLNETILFKSNLRGARLVRANLSGAVLWDANLSEADMSMANLRGADLSEANLSGADMSMANLRGADLSEANLSGADMSMANLSGVDLSQANLEGARFNSTNLTDAIYEPSTAPSTGHLSNLEGVATVTFRVGKHSGLVQLRNALHAAGIKALERQATYALNRGITRHAFNGWENEEDQENGILNRLFTEPLPILEGIFRTVFFEWPTGWGLYYGRPIKILFTLIILMSFVHLIPLIRRDSKKGSSGIYRIWPKGRIEEVGEKYETADDEIVERLHSKGWAAIGFALYFSLLSAFQIGWRDLNVGSWIARLQSREYFLRGRGWVRTVSGAQSLVSVYLLAMWALTYFGRPFQ